MTPPAGQTTALESESAVYRWTRHEIVRFAWTPHETLERLAITPSLRDRLQEEAGRFRAGEQAFHSLRLPWRRGLFLFGPAGCGKTAGSRALARALGWTHLTIPAHEILDAHLFERALGEVCGHTRTVIVLEDVDRIIRRMENTDFFTLLDHALERSAGVYWVACSRHPEVVPKTQLVRPGRFDSAIRLDAPSSSLRREILQAQILPILASVPRPEFPFGVPAPVIPLSSQESAENPQEAPLEVSFDEAQEPAPATRATPKDPVESDLEELTARTEGFTFAHFEELRQTCAGLLLTGRDSEIWSEVVLYLQDQLIASDRYGGLSDATAELNARVQSVDPRLLLAALEQSDIYKTLIEKAIGDAAELAQMEGRS